MEYTLQKPLLFKGKRYDTVTLSDYFKTRHRMALAQNIKETEAYQHQCLLMSFCENLPRECFDDLYSDDLDFIANHVNEVMLEYAESHGMPREGEAGKKAPPPAPRKVIRPAR